MHRFNSKVKIANFILTFRWVVAFAFFFFCFFYPNWIINLKLCLYFVFSRNYKACHNHYSVLLHSRMFVPLDILHSYTRFFYSITFDYVLKWSLILILKLDCSHCNDGQQTNGKLRATDLNYSNYSASDFFCLLDNLIIKAVFNDNRLHSLCI